MLVLTFLQENFPLNVRRTTTDEKGLVLPLHLFFTNSMNFVDLKDIRRGSGTFTTTGKASMAGDLHTESVLAADIALRGGTTHLVALHKGGTLSHGAAAAPHIIAVIRTDLLPDLPNLAATTRMKVLPLDSPELQQPLVLHPLSLWWIPPPEPSNCSGQRVRMSLYQNNLRPTALTFVLLLCAGRPQADWLLMSLP